MSRTRARYAPPGPEFASRVATAAWVEQTVLGPIGQVLITPAQPRLAESVEAYRPGLLGIAQGLGLAPVPEARRRVCGMVLLRGVASLDYGHPTSTLNVTHPQGWYEVASSRGIVHVSVGLAMRPLGGLDAVQAYLSREARSGELWSGVTLCRESVPASWLSAT
ncbi:hypothetical protein [Streptomyces sp. NPDC057250]|uniref:hypothetical protein n=1 Tax=Streptomyces sp. NPDC057250 TaxID=3346068 RepID=UPI0036340B02